MGFDAICGHPKLLESLRRALQSNRLHHAYLFCGPDGVGKRTTALALAMALHCTKADDDFCDACEECLRIKARNHPDVRQIEPLPGKKDISIQQVRGVEKELRFRSFSGRRKVAIIDPATLMNAAAQNALLKTLEEPPENSLLILIAPSAGNLLPTVRSRCLRLIFGPLSRMSIAKFLLSQGGMNPEQAECLAALSMGSLGAALEMAREDLRERRRRFASTVSSLRTGDYRAAMEVAETLAADRDEALRFVAWAESWYRDLLVYALSGDTRDLVNLDMLPELQRHVMDVKMERILSSASMAAGAAAKIQRNLSRRMVLEQFFLNVVGED